MPSKLHGHELVTINHDLVAIGGSNYGYIQSSMHRLTCQNKECWWQTLHRELLQIGRMQFVAILIPDNYCGKH